MQKIILSAILLFLLNGMTAPAEAQIQSVGAGGSFYTPYFKYWNEQSEIRNWNQKFRAVPLWTANAEFKLNSMFSIRAEGGYTSATARQSNVPEELGGGYQQKRIDIVPVSALFIYNFGNNYILIPYVGAGAGTVFVASTNEQKINSIFSSNRSSSTDHLLYAVWGLKIPATTNFYIGAEVRGAFGGYYENITNTYNETVKQHISLNGVQMMISVNYTFGNSRYIFWD